MNNSQNQIIKRTKKEFVPTIHEFNKKQRDLIIECYDDKVKRSQDSTISDYKAVNVDPINKLISVVEKVNGKTNIIAELGGSNVPTLMKLLDMLDITVVCKPLVHYINENQQKQRGENEKSKEI